jgi:hypothetical protein
VLSKTDDEGKPRFLYLHNAPIKSRVEKVISGNRPTSKRIFLPSPLEEGHTVIKRSQPHLWHVLRIPGVPWRQLIKCQPAAAFPYYTLAGVPNQTLARKC